MHDPMEPEWPDSLASDPALSILPCMSERSTGAFRADDLQVEISNTQSTGCPEDAANKQLAALKRELRASNRESFWRKLMECTASLCNAQYVFVARRVREGEAANEVNGHKPHLFGTAFYYNDGFHNVGMHRHRYFAGGNPMSHMDVEKPCLIPQNLSSYISFDIDKLPFAAEGYLAIPLFSGNECLAYFGLMWSELGLRTRNLSWSFLETMLFSLEDLIVQRVREDEKPIEQEKTTPGTLPAGINQRLHDETPTSSLHGPTDFSSYHLKPFARSLSHELRTPMQGIVGMLDVMHATVREAIQGKPSPRTAFVFQSLKESIEMVQDSARRAVEAADNVVHAYDLNMQVPKTPQGEREHDPFGGPVKSPATAGESRPNLFIEGNNITVNPYKRRKSNPPDCNQGTTPKQKIPRISSPKELSPRSEEVKNAVHESDRIFNSTTPAHQIEAVVATMVDARPPLAVRRSAPHLQLDGINVNIKAPVLRFTKLRDLLQLVVNESLHVGGRPDFVVSTATELGEKIEVRSRSSNGEVHSKTIDWSVDVAVPDTLLVDDKDLAKLISCVFLNAVKFTNHGAIIVKATLSSKANDILISIRDTGLGIPMAFLPNLFKPFARQDSSTTQSKDGLGLGLLVAKGLSRKMGGDLVCVRSSTSGPDRGSEFEIRIPVMQPEAASQATPSTRLLTPPHIKDPSKISSAIASTTGCSLFSPLLPSAQPPTQEPSPGPSDEPSSRTPTPARSFRSANSSRGSSSGENHDPKLGEKYPLTFLVAEDNKINRRVLVHMLKRLGYQDIYEACNGKEAVRTMQDILESQREVAGSPQKSLERQNGADDFLIPDPPRQQKKLKPVDVILMDLWMPEMDGYEATSRILELIDEHRGRMRSSPSPTHPPQPTSSHTPEKTDACPSQSPTVLAVSADVTDEALSRASKVGMKGYMTKPYRLMDLERLITGFCSDNTRRANDPTNA